jgi:tetratricopeptide (TPR) repeat protein
MRFFSQYRTAWLAACVLAGFALVFAGNKLANAPSAQAAFFNAGLQAYEAGDMPKAVQFFDRSLSAYKAEKNASWLHRFIYTKPSTADAAMASFHKGKALLQARQAELGVEAFKESIRLFDQAMQADGLSEDEGKKLAEKQLVVQYDLEMLFKSRPDLAQGEGKGKNGKGKGQQKGTKQAPGQDPGSQPGKGRPDDI